MAPCTPHSTPLHVHLFLSPSLPNIPSHLPTYLGLGRQSFRALCHVI